jgi:LETM1 and EF-hand domain-containing protein 1
MLARRAFLAGAGAGLQTAARATTRPQPAAAAASATLAAAVRTLHAAATDSAHTRHTLTYPRAHRWQPPSRFSSPYQPRFFSTAAPPSGGEKKDEKKDALTPASPSSLATAPAQSWQEKGVVLWGKAKAEARHYWLGTKLLWVDIKIAAKLLRAISQGHELTRRERKQLLRTSADLVRMVPFLVILVVPFAEFALPFLLKFFPNMLPSTYLDSTGAEAKLQKQLLVKMEMARFLQETTQVMATQLASKKGSSSEEAMNQAQKFRDFMNKVRTGQKVVNSDIVGFSKLFDSEMTLENLNKEQLAAMCRLLDIKVFGSVWVLRYKLQEKLRQIQKDDALIQKEGVDALSESELRIACRERGIYTGPEKDVSYLKRKLSDWLELSLEHQVPVTLLFLSRAFSRQMTGSKPTEPIGTAKEEASKDADELSNDLATTLAYVPQVVVAEAEKQIDDLTDDAGVKLKKIEEEAVEAAYEEIQARKEGKGAASRAEQIRELKTAVGVTQEKLEKLTEANVSVGTLIDRTVEKDQKEELAEKASEAIAAAAKQPTFVKQPSAELTDVHPTDAAAASKKLDLATTPEETAAGAAVKKDGAAKKDSAEKSKKKTIKAVDQLNDKVGAILAEIKAQTALLERLQKEQAALEEAAKAEGKGAQEGTAAAASQQK